MIPFFITIDTEGDCLWDNPIDIKTENSLFIPRFQELCEKYGFIPIWLTDYEMATDYRYVSYLKEKVKDGLAEIGLHVHALNNPPIYKLEGEDKRRNPYLIEYPEKVMYEKIKVLKDTIETNFECKTLSHRAGRWTIDQKYIDMLIDLGVKYDCTTTPSLNWENNRGVTEGSKGSNYLFCSNEKSELYHSNKCSKLIEFPVTIVSSKRFFMPEKLSVKNFLRAIKNSIKGQKIWLRPNGRNLKQMKWLLKYAKQNKFKFVEFMIHSSELMPGGSPTFKDEKAIEKFYKDTENLFSYAVEQGFVGGRFCCVEL